MDTTISTILYTSKTLSNGEHPLMLRLSKDGRRKYISLKISLNPIYWDNNKERPKKNCPNREHIISIIDLKKKEIEEQVFNLRCSGKDYTLNTLLDTNKPVKLSFGEYLERHIVSLIAEGRIGNARTFKELRTSIKTFNKTLDFYFTEIDLIWVKAYETFLRAKNFSDNSIGIRMRTLKSLYNRAKEDSLIKGADSPFILYKTSKLKEDTAKRALTKGDMEKIINFDISSIAKYNPPFLSLAKDLFIFSYLCCGMNLMDISHLKKTDIQGNRIVYKRQKTGKIIGFTTQPMACVIIDKYAFETAENDDYLFPILDHKVHISAQQRYERVQRVNKRVNKYLKRIGEALNLPIPLTTYVARHTYATVLKRAGVNIAIISESLGHSSLSTTQIYLDSFENSQIEEAMKNLI